ncbi:hypothetical protein B296_00046089 [Ensete ventricosum]|uniref:Uncharacterized protein n=1 Tax=Ensete ventricosum TaxID=4639 RepID=A0A426XCS3_ENSVE|nr:hypothetical protein B296_00046089 [Ensete ventricosum]
MHSICEHLEVDFRKTVDTVHPNLHDTDGGHSPNISETTLEGLSQAILKLKTEKKIRTQKDENKYSAGRGAHLNLKRAEKARAIVTKIPAINLLYCCLQDQKKLQNLLLTGKETVYGSKPSPKRTNNSNRRTNENGFMTPTPWRLSADGATPDLLMQCSYSGHSNGCFKEIRRLSTTSLNLIPISKDDRLSSFTSVTSSETGSPPLNQLSGLNR